MSEPMYSPPPPPPIAPPPVGPGAAQQVQGPAMGLLITAGVGILFNLLGLVLRMLGMGMGALSNLQDSPASRFMPMMAGGIGILFSLIGLAVAGFIIWASMQMKQLRNWNVSLAASIVAMIPCISPCCLLGLPLGIWALIVLIKPEVKSAFTN